MEGNRSKLDFKDHELHIVEHEGLLTHQLKKPNTVIDNVKFINTNGVMVVTGDYGNWMFCREFHPSADGYVSDQYWLEKLRHSSSQEGEKFDAEETKKELEKYLNDPENELDEETIEYLNTCIEKTGEGEFDYCAYAYREHPGNWDSESVIIVKSTKIQLQVVFDAFDEICRRLKLPEEKTN